MKTQRLTVPIGLAVLLAGATQLAAQPSAFTYQGRLEDAGVPAHGLYDLRFTVHDALSGGNQWGPARTNGPVAVSNGLFTVTLDFGLGVFNGGARWLEIGVRSNGTASAFTALAPRQALLPTPYAFWAANASQAVTVSGTVPASGLNGLYSNPVNFNNPANSFSGNGAGLTNVNAVTLGGRAAAEFWQVGGNPGTAPGTQFLGTTDNQPVEFKVNGQRALRLEPNPNSPNVLGGSPANVITNGNYGAVIAGGGSSAYPNRVGAPFATVVGGAGNTASANYATAMGQFATARGYAATALGYSSQAGGFGALAAGTHARAEHDGSFVWADNTFADFASSAANQFSVRAAGGVRIWSDPGIALNAADTPLITRGWDLFGPGAPAAKQGHGRWGLFMEPAALTLGIPGDDVPNRVLQVAKFDTNGLATPLLQVDQGGYVRAKGFQGAGSTLTIGTVDNHPVELKINSQRVLRIEDNGAVGAPNVIAGCPGNAVAAGIVGATISGGGAADWIGWAATNSVTADYGTIGGGRRNTISYGSEAGTIGGGLANTISSNSFQATIGGGAGNRIGYEADGGTISGGRENFIITSAYGATIAGGVCNQIGADRTAYIETGYGESAFSTIGGGLHNLIGAGSRCSLIAGGMFNTIGRNAAFAAILGGLENSVGTNASFAVAAGRRAKANHLGSFVWADATDTDFASTANNQFLVRASAGMGINTASPQAPLHVGGTTIVNGADRWDVNNTEGDLRVGSDTHRFKIGVAQSGGGAGDVWMRAHGGTARLFLKTPGGTTIYSNEGQTAGVTLAAGGGSWTTVSDRHAKENFEPVDSLAVLEKVAALPLSSWNYKSQDASIRHLGPMAQDFKAAFGLGESDTGITSVDADGVALAAIQGLNQKLEARLEQKETEITALKRELSEIKQLLAQLTQHKD